MTYNTLAYQVKDFILTLTLNRPEQLNAFTVEMANELVHAFARTRSADEVRAIVVTGPFMQATHQQEFQERCQALDQVEIITFDNHIELLMEQACAIVAMGGYNTFCEILSLDKPALIVPRSVPRLEQMIRAQRAVELG